MKPSVLLLGSVAAALVSTRVAAFSPARSVAVFRGGYILCATRRQLGQISPGACLASVDDNTVTHDIELENLSQEESIDEQGGALEATPIIASAAILNAFLVSEPAHAAATIATSPLSSAFAAYGHYFGLLVMVASLVVERFTIKPGMTEDEETRLLAADTSYGAAAILVLWTGFLRVTQYGKGWEFYQHEPLFWVKMSLFAVLGACSLFNTTKIIQKEFLGVAVGVQMSEKLAERMTKIVNAELLAMASIPLMATLMSRGVGYSESIPWQIGAGVTGVLFVGLGGKYIVEAITWKEDL